ncbi:MAG: hypothetical protein H7A51_16915 [Akkermansiaceae bacterium]|nr:hypothetical protein [Akkermansiaceae bacterium]
MYRLNPAEVLDRHYLEARCQLLELAAFFDRYQLAGGGDPAVSPEPRLSRCVQALRLIASDNQPPDRAKQLALLFSDTTTE